MKENVDLTENQIFTTPTPPTGLAQLLFEVLKVTKPWDFQNNFKKVESDSDLEGFAEQRRCFGVGNKEERQRWKTIRAYERDQICDRCGQNRGKKPWAKNRCDCYSMSYKPKIPWKF